MYLVTLECNDASLSSILTIVKNILHLIQIIGPIIAIIALSLHFFQLMRDPDNKKAIPKIKNSMIALAVLFFVPLFVDVLFSLLGASTTFSACWNSSSGFNSNPTYQPIESQNKNGILPNPNDYQKGSPKPSPSPSPSSNSNNSNNSNNGNSETGNGNSTDPIVATSGGQTVKQESTDTLKITIEKISTYYLTRVWMKNPYTQLGKYDSPQYGQTLYRPSVLMQYALNSKGLGGKLVVAFNASGFYLRNTYDDASVRAWAGYDKTSTGTLVITDGKVVRNAYQYAVKTWYTYGVDQNNRLQIYVDAKADASTKQAWSQSVIGKIRNTFTFHGPLVQNGARAADVNTMPSPGSALKRQALCQVDTSNFILITGTNLTANNLVSIMLANKCQTGVNLDGGGSIALLYKGKNSSSIETIIGNGRAVPEIGYFTE